MFVQKPYALGAAALLVLLSGGVSQAEDPAQEKAPSVAAPAEGVAAPAEVAAPKAPAAPKFNAPQDVKAFLDRVFAHLPTATPASFSFQSWDQNGKPTEEGFGLMPVSGLSSEAVVKRVMDVNHYKGNVGHVIENRGVKDARYVPPQAVRFYQHLDLSALGDIHHELVLVDGGMRQGYRVLYWFLLTPETKKLSRKVGMRSEYNVGAWLISDNAVGYALSSAPFKDDTNFLQWQGLTSGADLAAKTVVKENIEGMITWAKK